MEQLGSQQMNRWLVGEHGNGKVGSGVLFGTFTLVNDVQLSLLLAQHHALRQQHAQLRLENVLR